MKLYRHKENKKLYTIEHLLLDINYLNNNADVGIYAIPYKWDGIVISFKSKNAQQCTSFINDNFNIISE